MLFRPPNSLISFRDVYERRESLAPLGGRLFQREKAGRILGESGKNLAQPGTFSPAGRSDEISCMVATGRFSCKTRKQSTCGPVIRLWFSPLSLLPSFFRLINLSFIDFLLVSALAREDGKVLLFFKILSSAINRKGKKGFIREFIAEEKVQRACTSKLF